MKNIDEMGEFALEQENLVLNEDGSIYTKKIILPEYFTLDFADNQVELVTPIFKTIEGLYNFYDQQMLKLKSQYIIWNYSLPPQIDEELVKVAQFDNEKKIKYRENLRRKYRLDKLLMCGIHFNFSFKKEYILKLLKKSNEVDINSFKKDIYFKMIKNFYYYGPLLQYFLNSSPMCEKCARDGIASIRNSKMGFNNESLIDIDIKDYNSYQNSIQRAIKDKKIENKSEFYSRIRLKETKDNIYLELRSIDLDITSEHGIKKETIEFIHAFLVFLHLTKEMEIKVSHALNNFDEVSKNAYKSKFKDLDDNFEIKTFNKMIKLFETIEEKTFLKITKQFKKRYIKKDMPFLNVNRRIYEKIKTCT